MDDSILETLKKTLGVGEWDESFDTDLIVHINAALMVLVDLGVGPSNGMFITGPQETWAMLFGGRDDLEMVKSYLTVKVRLLFDPPSSSFVLESYKNLAAEWEWRLNVRAEGAYDSD